MARKPRDYSSEYRRRQELARSRGFRSYGQQRRYLEFTGSQARDIIYPIPSEYIAETYERWAYDYDQYQYGEDRLLDAWIRRSEGRGVDAEQAYNYYMEASRGGPLTRRQIGNLSRRLYGEEWNEKWSTS
ncbi:MAG TPA: hypothetical protein VH593_29115 [Ktedonobacteraceae bacterium]|jgi:hypothetical protein